jgi:hypothetical protein
MPRRFCPVVEGHGANVKAHTISEAAVPVHRDVGSVDSEFSRGFDGSADFVSVVFANYLAVFLKIRVYRQKLFTT